MANDIYAKARQKFGEAAIHMVNDTIKIALIDVADYTVNIATHDFWDDVPVAARVAVSGAMAGKSFTDGIFDATDVVLASVTGDPCEALIIFSDTAGADSTDPLLVYIDTVSAGLPITPNGADITLQFDNGANKIFKL